MLVSVRLRSNEVLGTYNIGNALSFVINPNGHIFAGTGHGVFRSIDNGISWSVTDLTQPLIYTLAINSKGQLFAGSDRGVFRSEDNGEHWVRIAANTLPLALFITINREGHLFAATFPDGIYRSTDNGEHWTAIHNDLLKGIRVEVITANSRDHLFAGTEKNGIFSQKTMATPGRRSMPV